MMTVPATLTGEALARIAVHAGAVIDRLYREGCAVARKADESPVTEADRAAEAVILAGLGILAPDLPVVAEESAADGHVPQIGRVFALVDPLDGTKEFLTRSGEFTVNIAIVVDGMPVMGVVYAPAISRLWVADAGRAWAADVSPGADIPADRVNLMVRAQPAHGLTAIISRSHGAPDAEAYLAQFEIAESISAGSSLKFCRVAEGAADIYPRFGRTMEWDTAAGHAVVLAAGGAVSLLDGSPLRYGKSDRGFDNPAFVVTGGSRPYQ